MKTTKTLIAIGAIIIAATLSLGASLYKVSLIENIGVQQALDSTKIAVLERQADTAESLRSEDMQRLHEEIQQLLKMIQRLDERIDHLIETERQLHNKEH